MHALLGVGGPRLDQAGGGWDGWPLVGLIVVLWIGRRVLHIPWGAALVIAGIAGALVVPVAVHAWGVIPTAGVTLVTTAVIALGRRLGPAKPDSTV
jgi:hypothetical protein